MWNLWYILGCFACLQPARNTSLGSCLHTACNFPTAHGFGGGWLLLLICSAHMVLFGGFGAWACPEERANQASYFETQLHYLFFTCCWCLVLDDKLPECLNVKSFIPLRLDWWLFTQLTQPCLCQKQWYIWISFSFYMLIWMFACLCACLIWMYCLVEKYITIVNCSLWLAHSWMLSFKCLFGRAEWS